MSRDPKATYNVFPHKMLHLVSSYLCDWLGFNPLREVFNGYYEILHLTNRQREMSQDVYSPGIERPWAID